MVTNQSAAPEKTQEIEQKNLEDLDDETLVKICQAQLPDNLTAYREIVRRYEGLIYNTCNKILGSREDAEEVAQDTLLQIFHKLKQFQGKSSFRTWLYKIVHNYCYNRVSKIIRKREGQAKLENEHSDEEEDRDVILQKQELAQAVEDALAKLKESEREIIVLKFMSGLTLQEAAESLGVGLSAAKMRLYRALESFKKAYERLDNAPPHPFLNK